MFMALYYSNTWGAQKFPFLSQLLFSESSNGTNYVTYNQSTILNSDFIINQSEVDAQGLPALTATYLGYLITTNMGFTATFVHMLLWNWDDIKAGWAWASPSNLRQFNWRFWQVTETPEERLARKENDPTLDPHYKVMLRNLYDEVPLWWWGAVLAVAWIVGLVCLYVMKTTLSWWGFALSLLFSALSMLFFGAQFGLTGFQFNTQPFFQMIAGYLFPVSPKKFDFRANTNFLGRADHLRARIIPATCIVRTLMS